MGGMGAAMVVDEPDILGFGHQVADRQDHAIVADDHTLALPLGAEDGRREGVFGHARLKGHDRGERALKVE